MIDRTRGHHAQYHILYLRLTRAELTDTGRQLFPALLHKWLRYTDTIDPDPAKDARRITNTAILEKYYAKLCQENGCDL